MKSNYQAELMELLYQIFRLMKKKLPYKCEFAHLSLLQIKTLALIKDNKNITMGNIADYFRIELPSATSLVNKLCDQKLIKRNSDLEDRRIVRLELTDKGKRILKQIVYIQHQKLNEIFSYLTNKEKREFITILKKLKKNWEEQL